MKTTIKIKNGIINKAHSIRQIKIECGTEDEANRAKEILGNLDYKYNKKRKIIKIKYSLEHKSKINNCLYQLNEKHPHETVLAEKKKETFSSHNMKEVENKLESLYKISDLSGITEYETLRTQVSTHIVDLEKLNTEVDKEFTENKKMRAPFQTSGIKKDKKNGQNLSEQEKAIIKYGQHLNSTRSATPFSELKNKYTQLVDRASNFGKNTSDDHYGVIIGELQTLDKTVIELIEKTNANILINNTHKNTISNHSKIIPSTLKNASTNIPNKGLKNSKEIKPLKTESTDAQSNLNNISPAAGKENYISAPNNPENTSEIPASANSKKRVENGTDITLPDIKLIELEEKIKILFSEINNNLLLGNKTPSDDKLNEYQQITDNIMSQARKLTSTLANMKNKSQDSSAAVSAPVLISTEKNPENYFKEVKAPMKINTTLNKIGKEQPRAYPAHHIINRIRNHKEIFETFKMNELSKHYFLIKNYKEKINNQNSKDMGKITAEYSELVKEVHDFEKKLNMKEIELLKLDANGANIKSISEQAESEIKTRFNKILIKSEQLRQYVERSTAPAKKSSFFSTITKLFKRSEDKENHPSKENRNSFFQSNSTAAEEKHEPATGKNNQTNLASGY